MRMLPGRLMLLAALGSLPAPAEAVNLVPNGNFESYTGCPTSFSQLLTPVWSNSVASFSTIPAQQPNVHGEPSFGSFITL